jgi:hypothetical protein
MKVPVHCSCGRTLKVKAELAGRKIRCPQCQAVLRIPEAIAPSSQESDLELELAPTAVSSELPGIDIELPNEPDTYQFEAALEPEPIVPQTATAPPLPWIAPQSTAQRSQPATTIQIEPLPKRPAVRFISQVLRAIGIFLVIVGLLGFALCAFETMRTTEFMPLVHGAGWLLGLSFTAVFYFASAELLLFVCDLEARLFEISRNIIEVNQPNTY